MKATAKAPANIAFIKYWGKTDPKMRLPLNNSISMNLSDLYSVSTVEFDSQLNNDEIEFIGENTTTPREIKRVIEVLDRVRSLAKMSLKARVKTQNNFPKATGIASSASGFAALSLAALTAAGVTFGEKELSKFARLASGTASRSIPNGFVEWEKGKTSETSYARQIFPVDWWNISDVVVIVTCKMKKVSSTEGHAMADTSPFYLERLKSMDQKTKDIKSAMKARDFTRFGRLLEDEALNMHAICLTSQPPLIYWEPQTIEIMKKVTNWREAGDIESYFTIDAGPSVHVICQAADAEKLTKKLKQIPGVEQVVVNHPAVGARLSKKHLF